MPAGARAGMLRGVRCLIVDDNELFLQEARELLDREGIDVLDVARTTAEACEKIAQLRPELTLVDIDLGGESGFDVVRALAAEPGPNTRVILISVHAHSDFEDLIRASAVAGFVSKSELSARAIHNVLGSEAGPAPG